MFAVLVGLIIRMVDTALVKVMMYGGLFLSILGWLFYSQPSQLVLLLPVLLVICCTVLFQGRKIKSRSSIYFVIVLFGAVLLLGLFGFLSYLNGLVEYTSVKFLAMSYLTTEPIKDLYLNSCLVIQMASVFLF